MFSPSGVQTPCVGVSIGIERIFALLEANEKAAGTQAPPGVQVYCATIPPCSLAARMKLAQELWAHDISAEFSMAEAPKLKRQLGDVATRGIPFMVIVGEGELADGVCNVKDMHAKTQVTVKREDLPKVLLEMGCLTVNGGAAAAAAAPPRAAAAGAVPWPHREGLALGGGGRFATLGHDEE